MPSGTEECHRNLKLTGCWAEISAPILAEYDVDVLHLTGMFDCFRLGPGH